MSDGQSNALERAINLYGHLSNEELDRLLTDKRKEVADLDRQEAEIAKRRRKANLESDDMFRVWWSRRHSRT